MRQWQLAVVLGSYLATIGSCETNQSEPEVPLREQVDTWLGFDRRENRDQPEC